MGEGYKRGHDGGGGGGGHRKKGKWFGHVVSNAAIPYGAAGVVVTCDKGKEKHAVRDVIRYMNESYETLVPSARQDERHDERKNKSEGDVSDALEAELRALKEEGGDGDGKVEGGDGDTERRPSRDRFKALKLDFRACAFIQMDAEAAKKCPPSALVRHLLTRTKTEGYPRSRHAMRIVPVDAVCFAGMEEIKKAVEPFVAKHFPAGAKEEEKKTFAIQFAARANNALKRMDVIDAVAPLVPKPHGVSLEKPDLAIMVEIMKGACCLSVVEEYFELFKYNIRLCGMTEEERVAEKSRSNPNAPGWMPSQAKLEAIAEAARGAPIENKADPSEKEEEDEADDEKADDEKAEAAAEEKPAEEETETPKKDE